MVRLACASTEKLFIYRKIIRYIPVLVSYAYLCIRINDRASKHVRKKNPRWSGLPFTPDHESLIDSKWKSCILDELRHRPLRPSELHKLFPEATPRVLDIQLKELVEDGLVSKTIFPELPPRSEYAITPLGQTLIPIIDAMIEWGNRNADLFERKYGRKEKR